MKQLKKQKQTHLHLQFGLKPDTVEYLIIGIQTRKDINQTRIIIIVEAKGSRSFLQ